jgi:glycosyltransferase involved in cell wall biosynthesis
MTLAIHYSAIRAPRNATTVYGLQVAVESGLTALFRYGSAERFLMLVGDDASRAEVTEIAARAALAPERLVFLDARFGRAGFQPLSLVFRPDLDPHDLFWQREQIARPGYAFCGLAHAIAGRDSGAILQRYVYGPSGVGDSIICPSRAIRRVVERFFDLAGETIARRFGGSFTPQVALPVIPLGVDFDARAVVSASERARCRQTLGLDDATIVLLWVGRLSALTKAHPIALFRAAEAAAQRTDKRVRLLLQGYFVPPEAEPAFRALAADLCPSVEATFVPTGDARFPNGLWAAGDIFVSLIDTVQESFGLTPIEAIAAGLPRVLSDWDGYRDSVTDGEDGFLIPTLQPPPGSGAALGELALAEHEGFGALLGKTALSVAVDHERAAEALARLIENPDLRRRMAEAAKRRLPDYAWKNIIPAYEAHWAESVARRQAASHDPRPYPHLPPEMPDPFTLYEAFPSATLNDASAFWLAADQAAIKRLWSNELNVLAADLMLPPDQLTTLLNHAARHPGLTRGALAALFPAFAPDRLDRTLVWLVKLGILRTRFTD